MSTEACERAFIKWCYGCSQDERLEPTLSMRLAWRAGAIWQKQHTPDPDKSTDGAFDDWWADDFAVSETPRDIWRAACKWMSYARPD